MTKEQILAMTPEEHVDAAIKFAETTTPEAEEIEEEMATWEAQLAQAILGALEHRGFYDCGKYIDPTLIEHIRPLFHHQLQKAREETIHKILAIVSSKQNQFTSTYERGYQDCVKNIIESINHYQSKLDEPN